MSIQNQRILFDDNGTESDLSLSLNDFRTGSQTLPYVNGEDYLYIASDLPFNHRYFKVKTANDESSTLSVDVWFGNEWVSAVDVIDRTESSGKSLATSGVVEWKTDRNKGWEIELDSEDVTGIDKVGIYNLYWVRLSWSADLKVTTELDYIGHKFSTDDILYSYYPDLNSSSLMSAFESGKTDWNEQHFMASETVIRDLKRKNIIRSESQILNHELFVVPAIHKVAELIYRGLGKSYDENTKAARKYYDESLDLKYFNVDVNRDANLSQRERGIRTGWFRR
jgi:hypothetical protein